MFSYEICELIRSTYFVDDLQTAGSGSQVQGSRINKVAILEAWKSLTVLEKYCSKDIPLLFL